MRLQVECFKFNVVSCTNEARLITFAAAVCVGEAEGDGGKSECLFAMFVVFVW